MTKEEAIEILKAYPLVIKDQQAIQDAIDFAVASLEADETYQLEYEKLDKIGDLVNDWANELIDDKSCSTKYMGLIEEVVFDPLKPKTECEAEDCINRNSIVDTVCEGIACCECSFNTHYDPCLLETRIKELPSAYPKNDKQRVTDYVDGYAAGMKDTIPKSVLEDIKAEIENIVHCAWLCFRLINTNFNKHIMYLIHNGIVFFNVIYSAFCHCICLSKN